MKNLTNEEFIEKLKLINSTIIPLEPFTTIRSCILVKDDLNIIYKCRIFNLLNGKVPTLKLAVNKTEAFITKANYVHNSIYNYEKSQYTKNHSKIIITCPIHGDFEQDSASHLQGRGCLKCRAGKISNSKRMSIETFLQKANKIHNNKYNYTINSFDDSYNKIDIICPEHGVFKQRPHAHLSGRGCPKCCKENAWGFSRTQWINFCKNKKNAEPKIYIARLFDNNENFIKIGITANTTKFRFYTISSTYSYEILKEIRGSADFIYDKENELHRKFKEFKYTPIKEFKGAGECFTLDIINLLT